MKITYIGLLFLLCPKILTEQLQMVMKQELNPCILVGITAENTSHLFLSQLTDTT